MNVLVTGSVGYNDEDCVFVALESMVERAGGQEIVVVHLDEPSGAEAMAGEVARTVPEAGLIDRPVAADELWLDSIDRVMVFLQDGQTADAAMAILNRARASDIPFIVHANNLADAWPAS